MIALLEVAILRFYDQPMSMWNFPRGWIRLADVEDTTIYPDAPLVTVDLSWNQPGWIRKLSNELQVATPPLELDQMVPKKHLGQEQTLLLPIPSFGVAPNGPRVTATKAVPFLLHTHAVQTSRRCKYWLGSFGSLVPALVKPQSNSWCCHVCYTNCLPPKNAQPKNDLWNLRVQIQ